MKAAEELKKDTGDSWIIIDCRWASRGYNSEQATVYIIDGKRDKVLLSDNGDGDSDLEDYNIFAQQEGDQMEEMIEIEEEPEEIEAEEIKKVHRCGICREAGHNRRKCPKLSSCPETIQRQLYMITKEPHEGWRVFLFV